MQFTVEAKKENDASKSKASWRRERNGCSQVCVYESIIAIIISVVGFLLFGWVFFCFVFLLWGSFSERLLNTITSRQHNESKCMDL